MGLRDAHRILQFLLVFQLNARENPQNTGHGAIQLEIIAHGMKVELLLKRYGTILMAFFAKIASLTWTWPSLPSRERGLKRAKM